MAKKHTLDTKDDTPATHGDLALFAGQLQHQMNEKFEQVDQRFGRLEATIERNHKEMLAAMDAGLEHQVQELGAARREEVELVKDKQQNHEERIIKIENRIQI